MKFRLPTAAELRARNIAEANRRAEDSIPLSIKIARSVKMIEDIYTQIERLEAEALYLDTQDVKVSKRTPKVPKWARPVAKCKNTSYARALQLIDGAPRGMFVSINRMKVAV